MSEVISFRLNKDNPREAQAFEVLNAWIRKGFSARFILTKALLELDHLGSDMEMSQDDRDLGLVLDQIDQLLEIVKAIKANPITRQDLDPEQPILHESFLASIKLGAKPGIKHGGYWG